MTVPLRVGFAGLGTMGSLMAARLLASGADLTVWNRTPGRAGELVAAGAREAVHPAQMAQGREVVVVCVTDGPQVADVLFGPEGLAEGLEPGAVVVDCSTTSPLAARAAAERLAERGVGFLDAPVSGGTEGARHGTLTILVGGAAADLERARPALAVLGSTVTHLGEVGAGQWAKAVNQVILAGTYLAVAEGVVLATKAGVDVEALVGALGGGAAQSWVLANRAQRMIEDEYPLGFKIELHRKDLAIALELARAVGAVLPVTALAATLEDGLIAEGRGGDDNAALAHPLRRLSGL